MKNKKLTPAELKAGTASALKALGTTTKYKFDKPDSKLLECFPNPMKVTGRMCDATIHIECPEFTSLCPKTGQPDFAKIVIDYSPGDSCVESKSLKLYLGSFRMHGEFHESCVARITNDLFKLLAPEWITVEGQFTPRGGIPFWPKMSLHR